MRTAKKRKFTLIEELSKKIKTKQINKKKPKNKKYNKYNSIQKHILIETILYKCISLVEVNYIFLNYYQIKF